MADTNEIQKVVLGVVAESSPDDVAHALMVVDGLMQRAREIRADLESRVLAWIKEPGEITVGDTRDYAGVESDVKCRNKSLTLEKLLQATGGDLERVAELLSADPYKHGACRTVFEESGDGTTWNDCFERRQREVLKDGVVSKKLIKVNERFIK
jgi:hypothetical protein